MRIISCSTSRLIRGLPGPRRAYEPSNLRAISLGYQPRTVPVGLRWRRRREPCGPGDDRSRRARLVRRPKASTDHSAAPHDAVFGGQIFVPRQQLPVHRPRYVGQHPRPIHNGPLPRPSAKGVLDYLTNCTGPPPDTDLATLPKGPASLPFQFFGLTALERAGYAQSATFSARRSAASRPLLLHHTKLPSIGRRRWHLMITQGRPADRPYARGGWGRS
jgi:hypothetical protein